MNQKEAMDILKLGHNIFLTGCPGSGKTFLLNRYINFLKSKGVEVGVTASTGIAATHMNGMTVHSWSGIGIKEKLEEPDLLKMQKTNPLRRRLEKTKVLIIDEISMLKPNFLDMVDLVCKMFKQSVRPFGGIQVILCGDLFQLPPVYKNSEVNFINSARCWDNLDLKVCYLNEQYRQSGCELTKILNDIRTSNIGEHTLASLRKRYKAQISETITPTRLYTHNVDVDNINAKELEKISEEPMSYFMESFGSQKLVANLKRNCLSPEILKLKVGALVMFVKNNYEQGFVNGTLGKVIDFDEDDLPVVQTLDETEIIVEPMSWAYEENNKIKAEIKQIPLRLAWAITVHKSQGMTIDAAEIDLSKAFVEGMGYVALSRLRSIQGLRLLGLRPTALNVNNKILELDKWLKAESEKNNNELLNKTISEIQERQDNFLRSIAPEDKEKKISTYEITAILIEKKLSIEQIAKERELTTGTIIAHLEKLIGRDKILDIEYLTDQMSNERSEKIKTAFKKSGGNKLSPAREILGDNYSYEEIRLVRLFLIKSGELMF